MRCTDYQNATRCALFPQYNSTQEQRNLTNLSLKPPLQPLIPLEQGRGAIVNSRIWNNIAANKLTALDLYEMSIGKIQKQTCKDFF